MMNATISKVSKIADDVEDICECLDQHTKALITIQQNLIVIAKRLNIELPKPLINMEYESGTLRHNDIIEGEVVQWKKDKE